MSMLRTSAIALVAVVAALVVENKLDRPSQNEDLAQRIDELQRGQQELRERSQRPGMQQARPEWLIAAGNRQQAPAPEHARLEDEDMAAPSEENGRHAGAEPAHTREEMHAAIEDAFVADRDDPAWSGEARGRAQDGLARTLPEGSTALSVRCGGSMCRIETRHRDMDHYRHFVDQALMEPATALWNGGFFSSVVGTSADGEVTVVSFLARDGQPLPVISRL
jgi:hypothetical protein